MTTATRKNPDYSSSAVNLTNPPQVKELLDKLHGYQALKENIEQEIPVELQKRLAEVGKLIADTTAQVKGAIEQFGSYQDVELGHYGVYQEVNTPDYHADCFIGKSIFKDFEPVVIKPTINVDALRALIKGNLLTEDNLREHGVITDKKIFKFVIR
jgi:hypothetical protein